MLQAKGLPDAPDVIVSWAKCGCLPMERPKCMKHDMFTKIFWHWWTQLNALARNSSPDGCLLPGTQGDNIQTDSLRAPSKNGWLMVLYSLLVWREWIGDGNVDNWNMAVADVHWVTIQLCNTIYYNPQATASTGTKRYVIIIYLANSF
jgi:hypothetical protein